MVLIEKLLRPGGWLLMDDLEWTYEHNPWIVPTGDGNPLGPLSESERTEPHLRAVFELIVKQHPSFTRFAREDEWYGWAQKAPGRAAPLRAQRRARSLTRGADGADPQAPPSPRPAAADGLSACS